MILRVQFNSLSSPEMEMSQDAAERSIIHVREFGATKSRGIGRRNFTIEVAFQLYWHRHLESVLLTRLRRRIDFPSALLVVKRDSHAKVRVSPIDIGFSRHVCSHGLPVIGIPSARLRARARASELATIELYITVQLISRSDSDE